MRGTLMAVILALLLLPAGKAQAQDDTEYLMEIGPATGVSFYMGDANNKFFSNLNFSGGIVARYKPNPRFAVKADLIMAGISGSTEKLTDRKYPEEITFSRKVIDFGFQFEGNFLAYGLTTYNDCHKLAPYYLLGIGLTYAPAPAKHDFAANFPIGIGLKYKLSERLNLGLEWTMRFSTSDRLDVKDSAGENPFMIKGGFMKNKDNYSVTMITLTYDILARPCDCN